MRHDPASVLTINSPWLLRFGAYLQQRFPPLNGLMFLIFFLTAYTYTSFLAHPEAAVVFTLKTIAGFVAVYSFFFRLRVMDEHKDFEKDSVNHPNRVLQSGLVSLWQLRLLAFAGTLLEFAISWWISGQVLLFWTLAFGYSLLMYKEFFAGSWLEPRLFLYAVSHMLVMPLMVLWAGSMGAPESPLPEGILLLGFLSFLSGFAFELSRKIKAPEEEQDGILTYSKIFGVKRAPIFAFSCLAGASAILFVLLQKSGAGTFFYAGIILLLLACAWFFFRFVKAPTSKNAKGLELASSLYMLIAYLLVITATLRYTGFIWN